MGRSSSDGELARIRLTARIDPRLHKRLKHYCVETDSRMQTVVETSIRQWLRAQVERKAAREE